MPLLTWDTTEIQTDQGQTVNAQHRSGKKCVLLGMKSVANSRIKAIIGPNGA